MDLPNPSLTTTYEKLCGDPEKFRSQLVELLPELNDIDLEKSYTIKGKNSRIINSNDEYFKRLTSDDIIIVNDVLCGHEAILNFWGYELL